MSFAEYQGERTRERARRSEHPSIFPVRDIPLAVFRLGYKNKVLKELAATIKTKGAEVVLPAEMLTTDDDGNVGIDLALFKTPGTLTQKWEKDVPGLLELVRLLDEDLLLSGGESTEVAHFRQERELRAREVAAEMLVNLRRETDFEHELVGVATEHSFATVEEKESFEKLETWTQNIVDGLFVAAGLTYMKPQVHVTRSRGVNAWVWSVAHEDATAEYLAVAKKSAEPVELPIFVHYGLLKQITSQDELAGVLAHEFSHLLQPNYLGLQDNESRQRLEYDADATGARLADAAGSNPRGLINFLRKLPESGTAQKFGWGTHPETARRIIELEKQFSRTDLPFPNAGKPLAPVPADIAAALDTIRKTPYRKSADFSGPRSVEQALESYLETQTEAGYYMNVERQAGFTAEARSRLKELQVEQELAHDVTGQRTLLLTKLESCLLGLAQQPSLGPDDSIYLSCPTPYKVEARKLPDGTAKNVIRLGALPERVLSLPKNLSFLRPGKNAEVDEETQRNISNEQLNQRDYLVRDTSPDVQASYAAGWRAKTIEDWIDPDNATVQPFWDEVIKNIKDGRKGGMDSEAESVPAQLTREERLYFIWNWLTHLVAVPPKTGGWSRDDFLAVDKSYLVETKIEIPLELPSKPENILSRLPKIAGRVHQRHEEGEPPIPIKFEIKKERQSKTLVSQSPRGQHLVQNLWDDRPEGQPPAITAYTELVQEQTMNAYREILSAEGVDDVDPEMLRYACARLFDSGYHTPEFSSTPPSNSRLSFGLIPEISISCLSQAIKILETRQLAKVFGSDETELSKHQKAAIEGLRTAVAFGFVPQNEEERAIQERHLRQIELYTSAAGMVVDHIPEGKECFPNERYTTVRGNRLDIGHMDTFQSATGERVWSQTGDIVQHLLKGKAFKALITPDELRPGEPSSHDRMKVSHGVSCAYFRAEERDVRTIYAGMEQALEHFPVVVRAYVDYLYKKGVSTKEGVARLYADETEQVAGQHDYKIWQMLEPLLDTVARELYEEFHEGVSAPKERYKTDRGYKPVTVEDFHHVLRIITRGIWPVPDLMKHARFATVDSPWLEQKVAPTNVPLRDEADGHEAVFFYTPHESPKTFEPEEAVTKERAIEYLELLAETKPAAATLAATLRNWPQKEFPPELAVVCLGHFSPFKADYHTTDEVLGWSYDTKATTDNVIKVWRQAAAVYHEEWEHVEQYKCLDEQLSTWEWTREDNNLFEVGVEKFLDYRKRTNRSEDLLQPKIVRGKGAESFTHFFETLLYPHLESRYRTASSQHTTIKFSWPLFMTDVWEGKEVFTRKETQEKCQYIVDAFRAELLRIVADPNNLGEIKKMQPGFFREFLLAKKLEHFDIKNLDELEPWLEYFTSYAHEGSARNQTTGLVETTRRNHREKRKEELLTAAVLEALPDPDYLKFFYLVTAPGDTSLTDSDVSISYYDHIITNDLTQLRKKIEEVRSDSRGSVIHRNAHLAQLEAEEQELRQFYESITTGRWIEKIYERYEVLVNEARGQASTLGQAEESDVFVFSDQVIENDRSRLEVGPIYRYRLAAQKLMDWHSEELRAAQTPEAAVALQARVDKVLPDRHPLKDVFVKNQAAVEIWQTLRAALTPEELAATGIELTEKSVDLKQVLAQFPLYAEAAFLPQYTIFEVTGLAKAITDIPRATAETILERLETVVQKEVSPDQHSMVRRLLIDLEKRVRWPEWRAARRIDASVYDEQVGRILKLFPEPSLERDDVLESIGMDLAYTPEQIRQVNHLTYIEQTRWPKEKEAKSLRPQHTGLEKCAGF